MSLSKQSSLAAEVPVPVVITYGEHTKKTVLLQGCSKHTVLAKFLEVFPELNGVAFFAQYKDLDADDWIDVDEGFAVSSGIKLRALRENALGLNIYPAEEVAHVAPEEEKERGFWKFWKWCKAFMDACNCCARVGRFALEVYEKVEVDNGDEL